MQLDPPTGSHPSTTAALRGIGGALRGGVVALVAGVAALAAVTVGHGDPVVATRSGSTQPHQAAAAGLHRCGRAYCGRVARPLDPDGIIPGTVSVYFELYRHTRAGPPAGTLVATEGGPGYPATLSREAYLALFGPLRADRDVLFMDNRGTGRSGPVDCHELQTEERATVESVARCGESLGDRASLYSTAYAADDLAAVLEALGIAKIDLYGDSYGTYFEQVFAARHPALLRSIVLDGAYPLTGPDYAWYPTYAPAMRAKFDLACRRSAACAALPGTSIGHIQPALDALREAAPEVRAPDVDGNERRFRADAAHLALVMFGGAPALTSIRETDAAARAFAAGDRLPLLRLMAETIAAVDSRDPTGDVSKWSAGLAAAVMCQDPPQIFDMNLAPPERIRDRDRALAERRRTAPDTYAPFTIDEYRAMPLDYSFLDQCVAWPVPPPGHSAPQLAAAAPYPDIPALVISGELDAITTPADGAAVAAAFRRGTQVLIANSFHVNALPHARSGCAADIVRRFLRTQAVGDMSCAAAVPPVHLVGRFARNAAELDPAEGVPGNAASPLQLRFAAAAALTALDVLVRVDANSSGRGVGLRGGTFRLGHDAAGVHIVLDRVRWTKDLAVSGTIDRQAGRTAAVHADLILAGGAGGRLNVSWRDGEQADSGKRFAQLRGHIGSAAVAAQIPDP